MILNDRQIRKHHELAGIFQPFEPNLVREKDGVKVISYGCSSFGYDVRLGNEFKVPIQVDDCSIVSDPKDPDSLENNYISEQADEYFDIPPMSTVFSVTLETVTVPDDIMIVCVGKSTYARTGLDILVTPIEPGFEGKVVLELANGTPFPIRVYPGEGICQFLLFKGEAPETTYRDRGGKYQNQTGVVLSRL